MTSEAVISKSVEGISLAIGKINLLNQYMYKLAEYIDKENPDIVIGEIERMMNDGNEVEEIAIRLRFQSYLEKESYADNSKNGTREINRA